MGLALISLTLVVAGSGPRAPSSEACPFVVVAEAGLTRVTEGCEEGRLGPGAQVELGPGGFLHVDEGGRALVCANLGDSAVEWTLGPRLAPAVIEESALPSPASSLACHEAAVASGEPVLVLDLEPVDVTPATAEIVTSLVAVGASRQRGVDVVSGRELVRLLERGEVEARQGCSDDESCLSDLAGALGARYVVAGKVAALGALLAVELRLLDSEAAAVLARADVRARDLAGLARRLEPALVNLLQALTGTPPVEVPPPPPSRAPDDVDTALGAALAGGLTAAGLVACVAAPTFLLAGVALLLVSTAMALVPTSVVGAPLCGVVCAPLGAIGGAAGGAAGDRLLGYETHALRTGAVAVVSAIGATATVLSMTLLSAALVSTVAALTSTSPLDPGAANILQWVTFAAATGGGFVAGTAMTAAAAAVTFLVLAVLFQPEDPLTAHDGEPPPTAEIPLELPTLRPAAVTPTPHRRRPGGVTVGTKGRRDGT